MRGRRLRPTRQQEVQILSEPATPPDRLLKWGSGGAIFAAVCCFTPLLVLVLAGVGLSAVTGWLDYMLFPLLFFSLALVALALWLRAGRLGPNPKPWVTAIAAALSVLIIWIEFRFALPITVAAAVAVAVYALALRQMNGASVSR